MIKRAHVRQFLAIVDAGSFTQAAARIGITQPTLSAGIADLERLVGGTLFVRDRRHIRLTEAGGRFLPIARGLEAQFRLLDDFGAVSPVNWPSLKLGTIRSISGAMLTSLVGVLAADYGIELLEGSDTELRAWLDSGRIHLAVTVLQDEESNLALPLLSEPYALLVARGHRLVARRRVLPEEVSSEVMIARRSCEILAETSRFFTRKGIRPRFALRSDSDDRCIAMVAAGIGITTAPLSLTTDGVVALELEDYDFSRRIGVLCQSAWAAAGENVLKLETALAEAKTKARSWDVE